jgi:hypothetical protein
LRVYTACPLNIFLTPPLNDFPTQIMKVTGLPGMPTAVSLATMRGKARRTVS